MNNKIETVLIANRECGECTVCCNRIQINDPELIKLPNIDCVHLLKEGGCNIYKSRPTTCATWHCAWRFLPIMKNIWRPDKLGAMLDIRTGDFPDNFPAKKGLIILVLDKEKILANVEFILFIALEIEKGIPMVISYGLEPGRPATTAFLNYTLKEAIAMRDQQAVIDKIRWVLDLCESNLSEKLMIENGLFVSETS